MTEIEGLREELRDDLEWLQARRQELLEELERVDARIVELDPMQKVGAW
jgi:predicted nuclease with TOPRIM domain